MTSERLKPGLESFIIHMTSASAYHNEFKTLNCFMHHKLLLRLSTRVLNRKEIRLQFEKLAIYIIRT